MVHNISAVDTSSSPPTANPLFIGDAEVWSVATLYSNQTVGGYPCLTTSTYGATLTFTLNETVAFVLLGSDDWAQGLFTVAVYSDTPGATSSITDNTIQYSPRALWTQLDVPKYAASGLDSNATYTIEITNLGANFNLASVMVYDALIPLPTQTSRQVIIYIVLDVIVMVCATVPFRRRRRVRIQPAVRAVRAAIRRQYPARHLGPPLRRQLHGLNQARQKQEALWRAGRSV